MNNKFKLTALALALSLGFAGCAQEAGKKVDDAANDAKEKVEEVADDAKDKAKEVKDDAKDAAKDAKDAVEDAVDEAKDKMSDEEFAAAIEGKLVLRRSLKAPHGEGSFARVAVVTDGDKIVDASIDEFQYFDADSDFVGLPNQDEDTEFKSGNAEGKILGSKIMNNDQYSALMKEKAGSTVSIADNYKAIQNFAKGKTIDELKEVVAGAEDGKAIDGVTGATLVDTKGYLEAIIETAESRDNATIFEATNADDIKVQQLFGTAGNKNAITDTFVVLEGDKIIAANIDEYQYIEGKGVPNSDKKFGENFADKEKVLASKLENNDDYSGKMKEIAKATKTLKESLNAIEEFVVGKTPEEIKEVIDGSEPGKPVDAISGATLTSTVGYLEEIYKAATK
ncbi:peptidoglycan-binding protein [Anaerococcus murdochii]|uniref:Peptidoglycan-binding protein n=1 Tax=Anaerococcus murdochii TaxID=411577 RepID=A0ABS7SXR2_9FIRM|nr:peptidoglycan-binding protein [Anaerococcus murdochii]MBZ2386326.1 peptidoglycan-binding protein [Anaerococcus murdochii]